MILFPQELLGVIEVVYVLKQSKHVRSNEALIFFEPRTTLHSRGTVVGVVVSVVLSMLPVVSRMSTMMSRTSVIVFVVSRIMSFSFMAVRVVRLLTLMMGMMSLMRRARMGRVLRGFRYMVFRWVVGSGVLGRRMVGSRMIWRIARGRSMRRAVRLAVVRSGVVAEWGSVLRVMLSVLRILVSVWSVLVIFGMALEFLVGTVCHFIFENLHSIAFDGSGDEGILRMRARRRSGSANRVTRMHLLVVVFVAVTCYNLAQHRNSCVVVQVKYFLYDFDYEVKANPNSIILQKIHLSLRT